MDIQMVTGPRAIQNTWPFVSISNRTLDWNPWKIDVLYSAFFNILVTLTVVRVPITLKNSAVIKKQKNVKCNLEWYFFRIFFDKMKKEHQISNFLPFRPPFHPFRGWFRKNPFLVDTYILIGTYIPNFTFLALVVSALRWSSVSQSISISFYICIDYNCDILL